MRLNATQTRYIRALKEMPQLKPPLWPHWMVELLKLDMIQCVGKSIYLTEKGHDYDVATGNDDN